MKRNLIGLHSLRGLAAITIVIFHTYGINNLDLPAEFEIVKNYFGLGVPLFFVISAFSLFLSTTPRINEPGWLHDYLIRRFFRIAPLFYFMIAFYYIFVPWEWGVTLSLNDILLNVFFLYSLVPGKHESVVMAGWTIGVEMVFYLIVPYLLVLITKGWHAMAFLLACIIISATFHAIYQSGSYPVGYAYMSFMGSVGVFAYGAPAYFAFKASASKSTSAQKERGTYTLISSLAVLTIILLTEHHLTQYVGNRSTLWGAFFALLIASQCLAPISIIANKAFAYLGNLSFGLYLCHPPLIYILKPVYLRIYDHGMGPGLSFILCVGLTIILTIPIAKLANLLIEQPGINFGEYLIKKRVRSKSLNSREAEDLEDGLRRAGE